MINKVLLKQILLDNRKDIESYKIVKRDIVTEGFNCYVEPAYAGLASLSCYTKRCSNYCVKDTVGTKCSI